eukprot:354489-Chlamydomonas_euryale.AAC.2
MVPPPQSSSWHPPIAVLYIPGKSLESSCDPVLTLVPCGRLPQLTLLMSNQKPARTSDSHPFAIRAPSSEGSIYGPCTPVRKCHFADV